MSYGKKKENESQFAILTCRPDHVPCVIPESVRELLAAEPRYVKTQRRGSPCIMAFLKFKVPMTWDALREATLAIPSSTVYQFRFPVADLDIGNVIATEMIKGAITTMGGTMTEAAVANAVAAGTSPSAGKVQSEGW